jgi:Spy/CpxP family protein refolding chaperone
MRPLSTSAMAVVVSALTSVVAVAQTRPATPPRPNRSAQVAPVGPDSQPGAGRGGPRGPQSGPGGGPADQLLRMRTQLELTDDQVVKLETLRSAPRPTLNQADMLRAQADLMDATKGDVNTEKARAAFDRMARLRTDMQVAQLKSRQDVRNVLTPAQRSKVDAFTTNMRARRGGAMGRNAMRRDAIRRDAMRGKGGRGRGNQMRGGRRPEMRGPGGQGFRGAPNVGPGNRQGMQPGQGPGVGGPRGRRGMMVPPPPQDTSPQGAPPQGAPPQTDN